MDVHTPRKLLVLDECWHNLAEAIESAADNQWLVILIGARGYPLGEHRRIGGVDSRLYSEQLHVPWLIRFPDARGQLARSGALTSHLDVSPTLIEWISGEDDSTSLNVDGLSAVPLATANRCGLARRITCQFKRWKQRATHIELVPALDGKNGARRVGRSRALRSPRRPLGSERRGEIVPGCRRRTANCRGRNASPTRSQ